MTVEKLKVGLTRQEMYWERREDCHHLVVTRLKGNHIFIMTVEKLKVGLTRQEMYWERREDCHHLVVSAMMTKTEFP